jgi:hypothetical protein
MSLDAHPQAATSDYREFPVPRPLADHFLCLWTQKIVGSQGDLAHRVLVEPKYEEFRSRTIWSLSNAFTSAFKELDPIPQFKATAKLGEFLETRFSQPF